MTLVLHYAPDNASLIIRLALEQAGIPYRTALVDRAARAQDGAAYRALNPNGLIPVLETPEGPLFETGAILLWLVDRYAELGPQASDVGRGDFLKWLFFLSNTPHTLLRLIFYPDRYSPSGGAESLHAGLTPQIARAFQTLDMLAATAPPWLGADRPTVLDFYLCALLRWSALYPSGRDRSWFDLRHYPALQTLAARIEALPCTRALQTAEGLGDTPFTAPHYPKPPEGSAT